MRTDKESLSIIKAFSLCETFGWSLDSLGIPDDKKTTYIQGFLSIISERNKQAEHERKMQELRMKHG